MEEGPSLASEGGGRVLTPPDRRCSIELSKYGILQIGPDIKFWRARLPGVGEVRPCSCPSCGVHAVSQGRIKLRGHGLVGRWVRGIVRDDGEAEDIDLVLRRYRCDACGAVMRVGPRGLVAHRRYSAPTMLFALALWSLAKHPPGAVRDRVSLDVYRGATSAGQRWTTLLRWALALTSRATSSGATLRARTASALRSVAGVLGGLGLGAPRPTQLFRAGTDRRNKRVGHCGGRISPFSPRRRASLPRPSSPYREMARRGMLRSGTPP